MNSSGLLTVNCSIFSPCSGQFIANCKIGPPFKILEPSLRVVMIKDKQSKCAPAHPYNKWPILIRIKVKHFFLIWSYILIYRNTCRHACSMVHRVTSLIITLNKNSQYPSIHGVQFSCFNFAVVIIVVYVTFKFNRSGMKSHFCLS